MPKECVMSYTHLLVSVAVSPESHQLVARAVSIARPTNARITLITLAAEPEMYNQLAHPCEDIRDVLQEETQQFLRELVEKAQYPVYDTVIATGELNEHILSMCRKQNIDLVICGNHNHSFFPEQPVLQNRLLHQARLTCC
jgi:universal stress protein C